MSVDVKEIADGLTEAQRVALMRHPKAAPYGSYATGWPQPARDPTSFCYAGRALMDAGLIRWTHSTIGSSTTLTPRGIAVRNHLLATEPTA